MQFERGSVLAVNVSPGFPAADVAECGPSVYACGWVARRRGAAVARLAAELGDASASSRWSCSP